MRIHEMHSPGSRFLIQDMYSLQSGNRPPQPEESQFPFPHGHQNDWHQATIFLTGIGTSTLVEKLLATDTTLTLNDISEEALSCFELLQDEEYTFITTHSAKSAPMSYVLSRRIR